MRIFHKAGAVSALATACALTAQPAFAQDRGDDFDGPYIQIVGGLSTQNNDGGDTLVFDTDGDGSYNDTVRTQTGSTAFSPGFCNGLAYGSTPGDGCRSDRDKLEYGARVGYDKRMGNFVVGALVEGMKSEAKDATTGFSTTPASYAIERQLDYAVSVRGRAGYTPGGGALFYATGGASLAKIDHTFTTTNTANAFDPQRNGAHVWGWQVGGGAEVMLTDNISMGLEYLYNRYHDYKYNVEVSQGSAPASNPFLLDSGTTRIKASDGNFDYHSLRATVGFRF